MRKLRRDVVGDDSYTTNLDRLIRQNQNYLEMEEQKRTEQSQLLGNILREQIKTNKVLKERGWKK